MRPECNYPVADGSGTEAGEQPIPVARVALAKADDCFTCNLRALELIADDIVKGTEGKRRVVIKPNFVSTSIQLASTYAEHARALIAFFRERFEGDVVIAEAAPGSMNTDDGYRNFGYYALRDELGVELIDLNQDDFDVLYVVSEDLVPHPVRVARTLLDPDNYIVSAARLKTHCAVMVTLSQKNLAVGAILGEDKGKIHKGSSRVHRLTHLNLFLLGQRLRPNLASIDGYEAMEGNGPSDGSPITCRLAIASTDFLAADRVATEIMGFDFEKVGYLKYGEQAAWGQADLQRIDILGEDLSECRFSFRGHDNLEKQLNW